MLIQPDTEIMQGNFGGQSSLKAIQCMGPFCVQPKCVVELLQDRFHDLAHSSYPAAQSLGPRTLAIAFGWTDYLNSVVVIPLLVPFFALEPLVHHIVTLGGRSDGGHPGVGSMPEGEEILG